MSIKEMHLEGVVVTVKPGVFLNKTYVGMPFLCVGGFGCNPSSSGKIFGTFLNGDEAYIRRGEIEAVVPANDPDALDVIELVRKHNEERERLLTAARAKAKEIGATVTVTYDGVTYKINPQ